MKVYKKKPLLTIVTVVFNGEKTLSNTINAVLSIANDELEYIIIDGGSKDKTMEIVKSYEDKIDYWASEEDNGIYDAMNKGVKVANGKYILFSNADDVIESSAKNEIFDAMNKDYDVISMPIKFVETEHVWKTNTPLKKFRMPLPHPGLIVKKNIFHDIGRFNTQYKYSADYDFILRLMKQDFTFYFGNHILSNFQLGGASSNTTALVENIKIRYKNKLNILSQFIGVLYDAKRFM